MSIQVNNSSLDNANGISEAVSDLTPLEISFYRQAVCCKPRLELVALFGVMSG